MSKAAAIRRTLSHFDRVSIGIWEIGKIGASVASGTDLQATGHVVVSDPQKISFIDEQNMNMYLRSHGEKEPSG
ncbi:hypothetical protein [Ochrobactrum teleogrylli]|uniref:Uncharacterized protein n=2 Tax=Brucella/Ochrobactrum group TaxID=2826938 RepID=A0ABD5K236_9HYPH|nr:MULTISPECIES: hypothetical protein [unclassified Ochrobactrum]MBA8845850.1 hypothetical protein [Ochrobactrum sp. RH1CCR137]MBA8857571.1 hypothetical protein [Ochrobactrum sp. RH1CCR134]